MRNDLPHRQGTNVQLVPLGILREVAETAAKLGTLDASHLREGSQSQHPAQKAVLKVGWPLPQAQARVDEEWAP